ncbi:LAME_0D02828g1_1 [Lachancea meyersii CBS 8951]|uniref:Pre-mRNA-processing factor 17 n=1 Tax=Lachancea meyersii CBS 8951 TaxID=1266667 RepID=A0A1G4J7W6_9SACH|nr:LAME_0D02828g1_1 [Lachancea meyersii CBS 8951]
MSLVYDYSSDSDPEGLSSSGKTSFEQGKSEFVPTANGEPDSEGSKRHGKQDELNYKSKRPKRSKRKGKGPWASWSSSDEEEEETGNISGKPVKFDSDRSQPGYRENEFDLKNDNDVETVQESSQFYGESLVDYQGRSFLKPPLEENVNFTKEPLSFRTFLPKKLLHRYAGHGSGTNVVRMLPKSGHLFLSGGNDNILRLWDMYHERQLLRDYKGHSRGIRDANFNDDGTDFVSVSFDQQMKIWDTETGTIKHRYSFSSTPNCAEYRPNNSNELIVGLSNSEIRHYDLRVSHKQGLVQTYDHHLSSIIALKYFPDGSKLISSSEDKTMRIWENQVNIPIKQISDTAQYSMPYVAIHPANNYFAAQSMDNAIYTFSMKPKYKRHPKKKFEGHKCAGYGIGFTLSPDGRYICSGDTGGQIFIWDWKTTHLLKQLEVPDKKPISTLAWSPQETSKLVCAGNGGYIYLYD